MPGIEILLLILLVSSLPALVVFLWFRLCRYPFTFLQFVFSLLAGAASLFPALFLQGFLAGKNIIPVTGRRGLFAGIFIRIALTEELSRLIALFVLLWLFSRFGSGANPFAPEGVAAGDDTNAAGTAAPAAAGMVAGFGFAILENAVYAASNPGNTILILRVFTAAPLHGACGARVGVSVTMFGKKTAPALFRFLTAVAIHGIYNFMLTVPGRLPSAAAVLIALSALASSVLTIRGWQPRKTPDSG